MSDTAVKLVKLVGRIFLDFDIHTVTGLHIGGSPGTLAIGNVDNPVIRNPLNGQPYVPGSSLRGKMRSQLEKELGAPQNVPIGKDVWIHSATTADEYRDSMVSQTFGVSGNFSSEPTRLVVRDAFLTPESVEALKETRTDLPFTEVKWEAAIDRVTSSATPRQQERVPAGAIFRGALTFSLYNDIARDADLFSNIVRGLRLVEEDYLGGQGARGSGQVRFSNIVLKVRALPTYDEVPQELDNLDALDEAWNRVLAELAK